MNKSMSNETKNVNLTMKNNNLTMNNYEQPSLYNNPIY